MMASRTCSLISSWEQGRLPFPDYIGAQRSIKIGRGLDEKRADEMMWQMLVWDVRSHPPTTSPPPPPVALLTFTTAKDAKRQVMGPLSATTPFSPFFKGYKMPKWAMEFHCPLQNCVEKETSNPYSPPHPTPESWSNFLISSYTKLNKNFLFPKLF